MRDDEYNSAEEEDDRYAAARYSEDEEDDDPAEATICSIPDSLKGLRACMVCTMVKSMEQFLNEGCDNCESFLQLRDNNARVSELTSHTFEGMVAIQNPAKSWVSKYQGIPQMKPGVYALEVTGIMNEEVQDYLKQKNIPFRCVPPRKS